MIGFNLNLQNAGFVIQPLQLPDFRQETAMEKKQKIVVIGAGPVGSLAALYAANRGEHVEIYELRSGESFSPSTRASGSSCR
jgi:NADPH-dependent 2,4-dienoyl-CoA reductase/sulfur reductase-like enzyme